MKWGETGKDGEGAEGGEGALGLINPGLNTQNACLSETGDQFFSEMGEIVNAWL